MASWWTPDSPELALQKGRCREWDKQKGRQQRREGEDRGSAIWQVLAISVSVSRCPLWNGMLSSLVRWKALLCLNAGVLHFPTLRSRIMKRGVRNWPAIFCLRSLLSCKNTAPLPTPLPPLQKGSTSVPSCLFVYFVVYLKYNLNLQTRLP